MNQVEGYRGTFKQPHDEAPTQFAWSLNPNSAELFEMICNREFDSDDKICYNKSVTDNGNILYMFDEEMFDDVHWILEEVTKT